MLDYYGLKADPLKVSAISSGMSATTYTFLRYHFNKLTNEFLPTFMNVEHSMKELGQQDVILRKKLDVLEHKFSEHKSALIVSMIGIFKTRYADKFNEPSHHKPLIINM